MSTTILRCARCPALGARLTLAPPHSRYLTASALIRDKLPTTNWGAPGGQAAVPPARNWGAAAPPQKQGNEGGARGNRGQGGQRQRQPRADRGERSDRNEGGDRGERGGGERGNRGGPRERRPRGAGDGGRGGGGDRAPRQSWGMRDPATRDRTPAAPATEWTRKSPPHAQAATGGAEPEASAQRPRSGEVEEFVKLPSDTEVWDTRGGRRGRDEDDRPGRRHGRESRSLLHTPEGDYLPPAHHHSTKRGKDRGSKRDREQRERAWVVDDDAALQAARDEYLRMQADKARKAADKAKKEAAAAKSKRAAVEKDVFIPENISVAQLAEKFGVKAVRLMRKMQQLGMEESQCRSDYLLNSEDSSNLALEYNLNPIIDTEKSFDIYPEPESEAELAKCPLRPPVVTIMGHVDHGKTTLLDSLRSTSVAAGEAGGITQHIAAFSVPLSSILPSDAPPTDATITFLDTPGHAAFTNMRARGASVTDLVVLVVAADDGVMPQTKEVIELVKSAGDTVGLVVAINKCDKPQIDVDRVKSGLGAEGLILEEDGGEIPSVRVSGLTKMGLDDLVETLSTLAELRDLRARESGKAEGYVLESHVDKGQGVVSTVLVSRGTLRTGASLVAGQTWARVRTMFDSTGREITSAGPGTPVTITGWRDVPVAGDQMLEAVNGEEDAKKAIDNRIRDAERKALAADAVQINARRQEDRARAAVEAAEIQAAKAAGKNITHLLHDQRRVADQRGGDKKELRLVIKGDVSGTVEAVVGSLSPIGNAEAGVKIIHTGVGDVTESDIMLAEAAGATIIGFNVECPRSIQTLANMSDVPVMVDSVIYRLIDSVRGSVAALLPPKVEYRITGEALVQQVFEIKLGRKEVNVIAGCKVGNGMISKSEGVRVLRGPDREVVYEGTIETLKHVKKDVTEMRKGTECGIGLAKFSDIKEGDEIVTFQKIEVPRTL